MRILSFLLAGLLAGALLSGCAGTSALPGAVSASGRVTADVNSFASSMAPFTASKYQKEILKTKPIAYFSLDNLKSFRDKYKVKLVGGARLERGGPIKSQKHDKSLFLHGMAYATTSLSGGIPGEGSMVAWVNLSELPSQANEYFYISGESQDGDDFDLQFQNDNNLYFYTGAGEHTEYMTDSAKLLHRWIMIAVSYVGGTNGFRNIYWNGKLVAPLKGTVDNASKTTQFNIGESLVFPGRYFQGSIDAVAVWNRPLNGKEIRAIYRSAR